MARIRTVKPEFWSHPVMSKASDEARLGAIGLLNLADDEGYFLASPGVVRSFIWPLDEDSTKARRVLDELSRLGYVEVRQHAEQGEVGRVTHFARHQRVDRANPSKLKAYFNSTKDRRTLDEQSSTDQGSGNGREQGTGNREGPTPPECPSAYEPDDRSAFLKAQASYPPGTYRQNAWINAERNFYRLASQGVTPERLIAAAGEYRDQQEAIGKAGSQFVLWPDKFFDPALGHWRGPFPKPRDGGGRGPAAKTVEQLEAEAGARAHATG